MPPASESKSSGAIADLIEREYCDNGERHSSRRASVIITCKSASLQLIYVTLFKISKTKIFLKQNICLCGMFSTTVGNCCAALQEVSFSSVPNIYSFNSNDALPSCSFL